jgi:hypothetical protein
MSRVDHAQSAVHRARSSLENALALWRRSLSVIPVPRPDGVHDGKRPVIKWREYQQRRPTELEIRRWFSGPSNVAVVTGAISGVVVVDVDSPDAIGWVRANLRPTPWIVRTRRGWHCYYRHPGGQLGNRVRLAGAKIDVRGDGGFVVGPGSVHASGASYRQVGDWAVPVAELPVFDGRLLERQRPQPARRPASRPTGDAVERARRYLRAVPTPIEGQGSDGATFGAACRLVRGFRLDAVTAIELLSEWAPHFEPTWIAHKVASASRYGTEPEGGLL